MGQAVAAPPPLKQLQPRVMPRPAATRARTPRMQPHDHAGLEPAERMAAAFWHQLVLDLRAGRREAWDWLTGDEYEAAAGVWMPHCSPADWRDRLLSHFWRDL